MILNLLFYLMIKNMNELNTLELGFIETYGQDLFEEISLFIQDNDLFEYYCKARNKAIDLFNFGFQYGLLPIVVYGYCKLKLPINIDTTVNGYYKQVNSNDLTNIELISDPHANDGIIFSTFDKYTKGRTDCMKFLINMKKFSQCTRMSENNKCQFVYTIVEKYISMYHLLDC